MRPAAFLDRDGTVIVDRHYLRSAEQVELVPGAAAALATLRDLGYRLVVVSNQSGIARGLITPAEAAEVHRRMEAVLAAHGVHLDAAYYCPHGPDEGCECRKPRPGLLQRAARELDLALDASVAIGDKARDLAAGRAAGCRATVLLDERGWEAVVADVRALDAGRPTR